MITNVTNKLVPLASLLGAIGMLGACSSAESDPEATGGTATSGGTPGSGGTLGSGTGGTSGTAGATCPAGVTPVIVEGDGAAGAEDGASRALCYPEIVCFSPAVRMPGLPFIRAAFAFMGSTADGKPAASNESGVMTAQVSSPEPGKVCMSGDDGAGLSLGASLGGWDGVTVAAPPPWTGERNLHAADLGITAVSFTIDTPPSMGIFPSVITFSAPCGDRGGGDAEQDGNPVIITSSGTTTLSFATDFGPAFDTNTIGALNFVVGAGAYDYCISNLKFLDANGDEVTP